MWVNLPYYLRHFKNFINIVVVFGALTVLSLAPGNALAAIDLKAQVRQAHQLIIEGQSESGTEIFEKLLKGYPYEWQVYKAYAEAWEFQRDYPKAAKIYERAFSHSDPLNGLDAELIQARLKEVKRRYRFIRENQKMEVWWRAPIFGFQDYAVKTYLSSEFTKPLVSKIRQVDQKQKEILSKLLGTDLRENSFLKLYIVTKPADFEEITDTRLNREAFGVRQKQSFFDANTGEVFIFYSEQGLNWEDLSLALAHFNLNAYFKRNTPNLFFEGMQRYLAYRSAKGAYRATILQYLELSKASLDAGDWQFVLGLLESEKSPRRPLMAWCFMSYLSDASDPRIKELRGELFERLRAMPATEYLNMEFFFQDMLSYKEVIEFERQWETFIRNRTFSDV